MLLHVESMALCFTGVHNYEISLSLRSEYIFLNCGENVRVMETFKIKLNGFCMSLWGPGS